MIKLTELLPQGNKIFTGHITFVVDENVTGEWEYIKSGWEPYDLFHEMAKVSNIEIAVMFFNNSHHTVKGTKMEEIQFYAVTKGNTRDFEDYFTEEGLDDLDYLTYEMELPPLHTAEIAQTSGELDDERLYIVDPKTLTDVCKRKNKRHPTTNIRTDIDEECVDTAYDYFKQ